MVYRQLLNVGLDDSWDKPAVNHLLGRPHIPH